METLDWIILAAFVLLLVWISIYTNRITKSVSGFLSSERLAGRYLLTIAQSMAFFSAIGVVGQWENFYRNGIGGFWWSFIQMPVGIIIALSGWIAYRYRATRALTMPQFLEMRYSRKFRVIAGMAAFVAGMLNCAVFPMVTARFVMYFLGLPTSYSFLGAELPTYHSLMLLLVGAGVTLAIAGGQITIIVTDFFQGIIASVASAAVVIFALYNFGWTEMIDTLAASEFINYSENKDMVRILERKEGVSMMNPFQQSGLPDFGLPYWIMFILLYLARTHVWQGGAGYMTAARTPHEAKMGNVLNNWRWLSLGLAMITCVVAVYTLVWSGNYGEETAQIQGVLDGINEPYIESQMFVPIALSTLLPAGLLGLFAVYMIGASVSTDDSAYHSWGSIFLQDIVMPFRKKPFTKEEHLKYLRWSIAGIGAFAFLFSSIWTLKEFINMWFEITMAIYLGGAFCAVAGGLYWKYGNTAGAWAGLCTGSVLAVTSIVIKQIYPDIKFPGTDVTINGQHTALFALIVSCILYVVVSLLTNKGKTFNLDKLLHRGEYAVKEDHEVKDKDDSRGWIARKFGITEEFSRGDKITYFAVIGHTTILVTWVVCFSIYNLSNEVSNDTWKTMWTYFFGYLLVIALSTAVWFAIGGARDLLRLLSDLKTKKVDEEDDGMVRNKD
ncbi:sodium:solute symporter family protein [Pelagicoccus mobilis]|uniref:Sodium:solute symporter family protein n=1 Tax=Pelagicoccus mobilis TaxID=415221 RepID=A0A934RS09_9BACT|nr:sodium:solute symporter family protein [Pelagicoccus mobilis]MBK1875291.1 sodium:solute symporter family protein [Pelagicoccus mobilis]